LGGKEKPPKDDLTSYRRNTFKTENPPEKAHEKEGRKPKTKHPVFTID